MTDLDIIMAANAILPVFDKVVVTRHEQFGGEYIGETLAKAYKPGIPSYLAIVREVDGAPFVLSIKRDALQIYDWKDGQ
ncbi:hypothetical protein [Roseovarius sp. MMSF_3281]|uniref:hypothetical protein n=1 Tax=Roseovarius sp. MMSF_3281 TaxID=3046694 RepID=UPI00273F6B1E|nr:hypothetical protein [Roseovarius sp. MMSF_3281]